MSREDQVLEVLQGRFGGYDVSFHYDQGGPKLYENEISRKLPKEGNWHWKFGHSFSPFTTSKFPRKELQPNLLAKKEVISHFSHRTNYYVEFIDISTNLRIIDRSDGWNSQDYRLYVQSKAYILSYSHDLLLVFDDVCVVMWWFGCSPPSLAREVWSLEGVRGHNAIPLTERRFLLYPQDIPDIRSEESRLLVIQVTPEGVVRTVAETRELDLGCRMPHYSQERKGRKESLLYERKGGVWAWEFSTPGSKPFQVAPLQQGYILGDYDPETDSGLLIDRTLHSTKNPILFSFSKGEGRDIPIEGVFQVKFVSLKFKRKVLRHLLRLRFLPYLPNVLIGEVESFFELEY